MESRTRSCGVRRNWPAENDGPVALRPSPTPAACRIAKSKKSALSFDIELVHTATHVADILFREFREHRESKRTAGERLADWKIARTVPHISETRLEV